MARHVGEISGKGRGRIVGSHVCQYDGVNELRSVRVEVANLWRAPESPDEHDRSSLGSHPDPVAWLAAVDASPARRAFDARLDSQCVLGEPVRVHEVRADGWARVTCVWQPSRRHPDGYPGWIAPGQLDDEPLTSRPLPEPRDGRSLLDIARDQLGLAYLWGGTSAYGIDCSGLIHRAARARGHVIPRDADDQLLFTTPVELGTERQGDLYYFARPGQGVHHVGIVVRPGVMLHAPLADVNVIEEPLDQGRVNTLVAAGRLPDAVRG